MQIRTKFFLENSLTSVLLHLVVVAVMITSFSKIPNKIIAPEKMKIIDIDLSQVKVSREKTTANAKKTTTNTKPKGQGEKKTTPSAPAKETQTLTVNRESTPITRSVNVSVIDALRIAMTRCWQIDTTVPNLHEYNVSAHLVFSKGGLVRELWFENESALDDGGTGSYVLETIRIGIANCQPFSMLPDEDFEVWKNVKLNFFPSAGEVQ